MPLINCENCGVIVVKEQHLRERDPPRFVPILLNLDPVPRGRFVRRPRGPEIVVEGYNRHRHVDLQRYDRHKCL